MRTLLPTLVSPFAGSAVIAQVPHDQGVLLIRRGTDTLVTDRFVRTADTLKGSVQVTGQPRVDYLTVLRPNETVRSMTMAIYAPGAAAHAAPLQRIRMTVQGETIVAETAAGTQRVPTKADAIPMFNNAHAMTELFTRRARAAGGVATIPYFATNGGITIDAAVRSVGTDSMTVTIAADWRAMTLSAHASPR